MRDKRRNENYLTVKQIATILGVSEKRVRDYIKNEGLTPKKTRGRKPYLVHVDVFNAWLETRTTSEGESSDDE
jgi:excisionase family DNA binding protein